MKIIIFAGGIGTRLWPLSRKNSPKQFDKIFNGKSTLELAIERVNPLVEMNNIFIQTTPEFADAVRAQIPELPEKNIFIEPSRRNVGPAVCYGMLKLRSPLSQKGGSFSPSFEEGVRGRFSAAGTGDIESERARDEIKKTDARTGYLENKKGLRTENPAPTLPSEGMERAYEPVAILWADHLMQRVEEFRNALTLGEKLINENPERFIFLAERPRFANNNLGWIHAGGGIETAPDPPSFDGTGASLSRRGNGRDALQCVSTTDEYFRFLGWKYKPEPAECDRMFKGGDYFWNPGYFISSVEFILGQYKKLAPDIYENVKNAVAYPEDAFEHYEKAEKVSFDRAIIEKTDLLHAVVIKTNMGWSDPGTLYALKEALEKSKDDNVIKGKVVFLNTKDSLLYNFEGKKLLAAVGLEGFVVINTDDAIIIVPKDEVVNVTKLVEKIGEEGYEDYL